jgi:hypothetical protein
MFRTSKFSSSGRPVHAVLWYFFHASVEAVWSMAGCAKWASFGKQNWHQAHPAIDQTASTDA